MSLCGLKFEKLMRNNKLIKAQFERLVEMNMMKGDRKNEFFDMHNEAKIYGFDRINIEVKPIEGDSEGSDIEVV